MIADKEAPAHRPPPHPQRQPRVAREPVRVSRVIRAYPAFGGHAIQTQAGWAFSRKGLWFVDDLGVVIPSCYMPAPWLLSFLGVDSDWPQCPQGWGSQECRALLAKQFPVLPALAVPITLVGAKRGQLTIAVDPNRFAIVQEDQEVGDLLRIY